LRAYPTYNFWRDYFLEFLAIFFCDSVFVVCEGWFWTNVQNQLSQITTSQARLWQTHNLYLCLVITSQNTFVISKRAHFQFTNCVTDSVNGVDIIFVLLLQLKQIFSLRNYWMTFNTKLLQMFGQSFVEKQKIGTIGKFSFDLLHF